MRYCMQYLKTANVHLVKDMGMIPYKLYEMYGYDSKISTYKNGDYDYMYTEVQGLKLDFIDRKFNNFGLDGSRYLVKHAKEIDTLQIFHVTLSSVMYAFTYKYYNPNGKIYLKLDCSHKLIERISKLNSIALKFLNKFLDKIDLISVEQEVLYGEIKKLLPKHSEKIIIIPNGVDFEYLKRKELEYNYENKENIILNVARIGAEEKNTPMLLNAFANIEGIGNLDWKLVLVGPIEENFYRYIEDFFAKYPLLKDKIIFKGNIEDRKTLYEEYSKAKIFSLTSDFESFGIAFIEAAAFGDVIISTDVGIASEIVRDKYGKLVNAKDDDALTRALEEYISKDSLKNEADATFDICKERFDWNKIIYKLNNYLQEIGSERKV